MCSNGYTKFNGVIRIIDSNNFLLDCFYSNDEYGSGIPAMTLELTNDRIREFDRKFIIQGAYLNVYIRYADMNGNKNKMVFRFPHPYWTEDKLRDSYKIANTLSEFFKINTT